MKKISLIKKLSIGVAPIVVVTPLIFTATSCSKADAILTHYLSYNKFKDDEFSVKNLKQGYFSKDDLLLGSKSFCDGNYIMFVGSNAFDTGTGTSPTSEFFTGSKTQSTRLVSEWFSESMYDQSYWYKDLYASRILHEIDRDFGIVAYIDNFDFKFYTDKGREFKVYKGDLDIQNIGPFDKWNKESGLLTNTRANNLDKDGKPWFDQDEEIEEDDYIRNDAQAKAYRAFANRGLAMFPTTDDRKITFNTADNNTAGLMVVYKDGRLKDILDLPTKHSEKDDPDDKDTGTLFGTINKYFTPEEEEK